MTLQVHDTFTAANGTLLPAHTPDLIRSGDSYVEGRDAGVINSNRYEWTNGARNSTETVIDLGTSEQFLRADFQMPTTAGGAPACGFWARYVDTNNNWLLLAHVNDAELQIYDQVATVFTKRAFLAQVYTRGDLLDLEVRTRGNVIQVIDHTNGIQVEFTSTTHQSATVAGLFLQAIGSTGFIDNFKAYDMTPINTLMMGRLPRMESFPSIPTTIKP